MEKHFSTTNSSKDSQLEIDSEKMSFLLHLADSALILAQRNAEWCGHGPILEQDIAITNISLDLIGQARNFYQYAATLIGNTDEDKLAYLRTEREFKNLLLVEQPNGDWGQTILRQFFFSTYQFLLYNELQKSTDQQIAAIVTKSLKEVTYHLRWSSEWVIRLGDGTEESRQRMLNAIDKLWMYTGELFIPALYETEAALNGTGCNISNLKPQWEENIRTIFIEATLPYPGNVFNQTGGKDGRHSEHLGYILAEMQYMQRTYPGSKW
ncbi:MAG: phenylacetate-CoA oxygenase subunit PaaC [Chitinophagaceae bacterium]